jgi:hypothetical protein
VRRKDLYWSVRAVYVLQKRPDVSGPGLEEAGRYSGHPPSPPFHELLEYSSTDLEDQS